VTISKFSKMKFLSLSKPQANPDRPTHATHGLLIMEKWEAAMRK
jgi:hypothetical protein